MRTAGLVLVDLVLAVARALLARVRQPAVMAEVLAGLLLGASVLGALGQVAIAGLLAHEARATGALMNARGLVELVVLAVGLEAGLVDERLFAVMVLVALVTTFATGRSSTASAGRRR